MILISKELKQINGVWHIVRTYEEREKIDVDLLSKSEEDCKQQLEEIKELKERIK
jgi:hypothetical protein